MSEHLTGEKETAIRILEYWFTIEFLNQQDLNVIKNTGKETIKYINKLKFGKNKKEKWVVENFVEFKYRDSLPSMLKSVSDATGFKLYSDFTVFIGCVKKELCIRKIARNVDWNGQIPEENNDEIALATFDISKNGSYISNSLSISPLAWAVKRLSDGISNASQKLSPNDYRTATKDIEDKIKGLFKSVEEIGLTSATNESSLNSNSLSYNQLKSIEKIILEELNIEDSDNQSFFGVYFKLYKTEEVKKNNDAKMGLRMDFYSDDLAFAVKGLRENLFTEKKQKLLLDYILGLKRNYDAHGKQPYRFDIVNPRSEEDLYSFIWNTLTAAKAPLGKWPSRFKPALMQQIAVNFAINEDVNLPVFSVNGPPGTGKTTLLKEIIVNNIIEKAKLLTKYKDPDEAFNDFSFAHGTGSDNSYHKNYKKYHRLKNKKIGSYSILVTSSNNTAVENITKELPVEERILDDIKPSDAMSGLNDEALAELTKLFTVSESKETLPYKKWEEGFSNGRNKKSPPVVVDEPDIYFSKLATDLLNAELEGQTNIQAFGLISAALGKKSNIGKVDTKIINPLLEILNNDYIKNRKNKNKFKDVCKQFNDQLILVEKLREEQDKLLMLKEDFANERRMAKEKSLFVEGQRKEKSVQLLEIDTVVQQYSEYIAQLNSKKSELDERYESIHANQSEIRMNMDLLNNDIQLQ